MIRTIKMLDQVIPVWEVLVIIGALLAIVIVLILWWAFGYNLVVISETPASMGAGFLARALVSI